MLRNQLDGKQIAHFSTGLDQLFLDNKHIIGESTLALIDEYFGYTNSCFTLYNNNQYYRTISHNEAVAFLYAFSDNYCDKDPIRNYINNNLSYFLSSQAMPIRSSEILRSCDEVSVQEYMDFLAKGHVRYVAVAPARSYRLVLYKQEVDFDDHEIELLSEIADIIKLKYKLSHTIHIEKTLHTLKNNILNDMSVGFVVLNEKFEVIDYSRSLTFFLKPQARQIIATTYFGALVKKYMSNLALGGSIPIGTPPVFLEGCEATLALHSTANDISLDSKNRFVFDDYYSNDEFYVITVAQHNTKAENDLSSFSAKYGLTIREVEIIDALSCGANYDDVANKLYISTSTLRTHVKNIYAKLGINNQRALMALYNTQK